MFLIWEIFFSEDIAPILHISGFCHTMAYFEGLATAARESVDGYARKIGSSFEEFATEAPMKAAASQGEQVERRPAPSSFEEPPFDDESIRKSEEEMRKAIENSTESVTKI